MAYRSSVTVIDSTVGELASTSSVVHSTVCRVTDGLAVDLRNVSVLYQ